MCACERAFVGWSDGPRKNIFTGANHKFAGLLRTETRFQVNATAACVNRQLFDNTCTIITQYCIQSLFYNTRVGKQKLLMLLQDFIERYKLKEVRLTIEGRLPTKWLFVYHLVTMCYFAAMENGGHIDLLNDLGPCLTTANLYQNIYYKLSHNSRSIIQVSFISCLFSPSQTHAISLKYLIVGVCVKKA